VSDSTIAGSKNAGLHALTVSGGAVSTIVADRTLSVDNGTGYLADGPKATVALNDSAADGNATGVDAPNSGVISSYKNNSINFNSTTNGTPTGQINLQ
jgi:hypothetical protein